ncbi:MAG TPA: hypothetical protein VK947_14060 [Planococcus sp. (in: firmicutes)]|nr:hypothetical protein [Planococcus sp. (in: firmicutes)]
MTHMDLMKSLETMIYFKDTVISEEIVLPDGETILIAVLKGTTTIKVVALNSGDIEIYDSKETAYTAIQSRLSH